MTAEAEPVKVFYSYAHEDEELRNELNKHLSLLCKQRLISEWHDRCILPGSEWQNELDQHLETARLILLLISPDFIASDYCYEVEMKQALAKHEARAARVVPIILRPTYWQNAPFSELNFLPTEFSPGQDLRLCYFQFFPFPVAHICWTPCSRPCQDYS